MIRLDTFGGLLAAVLIGVAVFFAISYGLDRLEFLIKGAS